MRSNLRRRRWTSPPSFHRLRQERAADSRMGFDGSLDASSTDSRRARFRRPEADIACAEKKPFAIVGVSEEDMEETARHEPVDFRRPSNASRSGARVRPTRFGRPNSRTRPPCERLGVIGSLAVCGCLTNSFLSSYALEHGQEVRRVEWLLDPGTTLLTTNPSATCVVAPPLRTPIRAAWSGAVRLISACRSAPVKSGIMPRRVRFVAVSLVTAGAGCAAFDASPTDNAPGPGRCGFGDTRRGQHAR